jgi:sucrose-6-phosphate hydrolase SacC (GH32 family)
LSFPILSGERTLEVRVLVDRSIAEFFVAQGRAVVTRRAYPLPGEDGIELAADAAVVVEKATVYEMGCGWA